MKKPAVGIFIFVMFLVCLWISANLTGWIELLPISSSDEIYKCQCPGTFEIALTKGTKYEIWVYRKFRQRLKETKFLIPAVRIDDKNDRKQIKLLFQEQYPDLEYNHLHNFGVIARVMFSFEAPTTGRYLLSCNDVCILAIVPQDLSYPATTIFDHWWHYPGAFNDANFINPISK